MAPSICRLTLVFALLLIASVSAAAQDKPEVAVEYDRFQDVTTVGFLPTKTHNPMVFFSALFQCPGNGLCKPDAIVLAFAIITLNGESYEGQGIARAIRDGVRQDASQLKYVGIKKVLLLPGHVFLAKVRPESLIKIANSKLVEYQIDNTEFALTADNLAGLRALVSRMQ